VIQPKTFKSTAQVKAALSQATEILRHSEGWLPKGKDHLAPQLNKVGEAIANAMDKFISHIERFE